MRILRLAGAAAALVISTGAVAHDFWIEPTTHRPGPGRVVGLGLRVGEGFVGDPVPRDPARIDSFVLLGPDGTTPVAGRDGADPAGLIAPGSPGMHVVAYRSHRAAIELPGDRFERYLAEEGLDAVLAERARRGERDRPGREVYSRCAKALIDVPGGTGAGFDRVAGLRLELVPESDPFRLASGGELAIRLLFEGQPVEGVRVAALPSAEPAGGADGRTDREGRVRLSLSRPGRWLVKAVHMIPARSGLDADWESLWASLTFEVAP